MLLFKYTLLIRSNISSISLFYTSQRKQYLMNASDTEQLKVKKDTQSFKELHYLTQQEKKIEITRSNSSWIE